MKLRYGFVSNSSSSSFVLLIELDTHNEILKEMEAKDRKIIIDLQKLILTERKINGKPFLFYHNFGSTDIPPTFIHKSAWPDKYKETITKSRTVHHYDCELKKTKLSTKYCPKCGYQQSFEVDKHNVDNAIRRYFRKVWDLKDKITLVDRITN